MSYISQVGLPPPPPPPEAVAAASDSEESSSSLPSPANSDSSDYEGPLPALVPVEPSSTDDNSDSTDSEESSSDSEDSDSVEENHSGSDSSQHSDEEEDPDNEVGNANGQDNAPPDHDASDQNYDSGEDAGDDSQHEDSDQWSDDVEEVDGTEGPDVSKNIVQTFQDTWLREMHSAANAIRENAVVNQPSPTSSPTPNENRLDPSASAADDAPPTSSPPSAPSPSRPCDGAKPDMELVATVWYESMCAAIKAAADETLPPRKTQSFVERKVSNRTKKLYKLKKRLQSRAGVSKKELQKIQQRITQSCCDDFKKWVNDAVIEMEKADAVGNTRKIYNLANMLSNKPKRPPTNLTTDDEGNLLNSPEDVAKTWEKFLSQKFSATEEEHQRPELPPLEKTWDPITRKEFDAAMKRLKTGKAIGPDGVPAAVFKNCPMIKDELFRLLQFMWNEEVVPQSMVTAKFTMLFKNKGSSDDPSKYRGLALLNHAYKVLSYILLGRLLSPSEGFLQDWQAGFRAGRGCRDNSMILRVMCDKMMAMGKSLAAVFIDYKAAFDTVSHKFIDTALEKAGVSPKARSMFRAIYKAAAAYTTAPGTNGKKVRSNLFTIARGVLQGDVTSPLFFILALELILRRHDAANPGTGIPIADIIIHQLGYADDLAALDEGSPAGIQRLSDRVSSISQGSKKDADMTLNKEKTIAMHIREQDATTPTTAEEAMGVCKFTCPHLNCGFKFVSMAGLKVHMGRCSWKDEYEVDRIVDHRGSVVSRQYKVRWKDYSSDFDTWEPRGNLHPSLIKEYEISNDAYHFSWKYRCGICDLPCSSERGIKIHQAHAHKQSKSQRFAGSLADAAVKTCKLVEQQASRPRITCEGVPLKNVFKEKYLGSVFSADADQTHDIKARIAQAYTRCGNLRHVLDAKQLSVGLKLRLYKAAVCSILTYGCETWRLTPSVMRTINGANSKMLSRFTGKTIPQEARAVSSTFNLVRHIRIRRLKWLGHILRAGPSRLIYQAVEEQRRLGLPDNILMDAPPHLSLVELAIKAKDRATWKAVAKNIQ